jgi:hypothetical protein
MVLTLAIEALEKHDFQAIKKVMTEMLFSSKRPIINEILSGIGEKVDSPEKSARLLTEKVIEAIGTFGAYQEKNAKEHFGSDWDIITGYQTWVTYCEITNEGLPFFRGQFRQYAELRFQGKSVEEFKRGLLTSGDIIDTESFSIVDDQIKTLLSSMDRT